jgi:hypothetical protein
MTISAVFDPDGSLRAQDELLLKLKKNGNAYFDPITSGSLTGGFRMTQPDPANPPGWHNVATMQAFLSGKLKDADLVVEYTRPLTASEESDFLETVKSLSFSDSVWSPPPAQPNPADEKNVNIVLERPIVVPDIPLLPAVSVPSDASENFEGFSFRPAKGWQRSVTARYDTWTEYMGVYDWKDTVYFTKLDPQTHEEVARLSVFTRSNEDENTMASLKGLNTGKFEIPFAWGPYSCAIDTDTTVSGPITMQNHAELHANLLTSTFYVEIDADYKKLTLSQEDVDEFVAMAHSFRAISAGVHRVPN